MATRRPSRAVQIGAALAAVALLAGVLAGVVAVIGGDDATSSTTSTLPTTTTTPLSAEQYSQRGAVVSQLIAEAAGERCALAVAYTDLQALPPPADSEQMRALIGVTVELLRASAASATVDQPEAASQIGITADALEAEAEAAGYEPGWLSDASQETALADPGFETAFAEYQELTYETCFADAATAPESGD